MAVAVETKLEQVASRRCIVSKIALGKTVCHLGNGALDPLIDHHVCVAMLVACPDLRHPDIHTCLQLGQTTRQLKNHFPNTLSVAFSPLTIDVSCRKHSET